MSLSEKDQTFIDKRKKLTKYFPICGWGCLAILAGYITWAYLKTPMLLNPFIVQERILNKQIEQSSLVLMSVMLPVAFSTVFFILIVLVVFMFIWNSHEKKYLKIIEQMDDQASNLRYHDRA